MFNNDRSNGTKMTVGVGLILFRTKTKCIMPPQLNTMWYDHVLKKTLGKGIVSVLKRHQKEWERKWTTVYKVEYYAELHWNR